MPRNTTSNSRSAGSASASNKKNVADIKAEDKPVENPEPTQYRVRSEELDPNMYVPVRNGFNGKLIYISRKSGERYTWEHFGDEQDMELRELRAAKTTYKSFFENNWFLIDDPAVIEYLGVERYYANALSYNDFDTLFELSPNEIEEKIAQLSDGQKSSLKYRVRQLIRDGAIDSIKVINTLEKSLGVELIEK